MDMMHLSTNDKLENILAVAEYIVNDVKDEKIYVGYNPYIQEPLYKGVKLRPEYVNELAPLLDIVLSLGAQNFNMPVDFKFAGKTVRSNIMTFLVFSFYEYQNKRVNTYQIGSMVLGYLLGLIYVPNNSEVIEIGKGLAPDLTLIYLIDRLGLHNKSKNGIVVEKRDNDKLVSAVYKWNSLRDFLDDSKIKDIFVIDMLLEFRDDIMRIDVSSYPTRYDIKGTLFTKSEPLDERFTASGVSYCEQKLIYATDTDTVDFFDILKDC